MANVFISYSRQDQAFVRKLNDALTAVERTTWVDWDAIPPRANWQQEIDDAIEGADAFVFVLSPDSLTSDHCQQEVAHALQAKKRIVPVLAREVSGREVKARESLAPLADLNWILYRPDDDFDTAFQQLLFALDTDLDYWRLSSQLLVRARQWERKQHSASFTLQRQELEEAERWLADSATKQPSPTALHVQFITASRRGANARLRRLLAGISVALVVTLILAVLSFTQFQLAQRAERTALDNLQLATTRQLAAESLSHLDDQPDLALLLGVQSYRTLPTVEARDSLLTALEHTPQLAGFVHGSYSRKGNIAISPDGRLLAWPSPAPNGKVQVRFFDTHTLRPVGSALMSATTVELQVVFSPDGKRIATTDETHKVTLWDVTTRTQLGPPLSIPGDSGDESIYDVRSMAFSSDGALFAWVTSNSTIAVYDLRQAPWRGSVLDTSDLKDFTSNIVLAFRPNSTTLVLSGVLPVGDRHSEVGEMVTWDSIRGVRLSLQQSDPVTGTIETVSLSPTGTTVAMPRCRDVEGDEPDCEDGPLYLWDTTAGSALGQPIYLGLPAVGDVQFTDDGKLLATSDFVTGEIVLWNTQTHKALPPLPLPLPPPGPQLLAPELAMSASGGVLVVSYGYEGGDAVVWNLASPQPLARPLMHLPSDGHGVLGAVLSPDGKTVALLRCTAPKVGVACFEFNYQVSLWDVATGRLLSNLPAPVGMLAFGPTGQSFVTSACMQLRPDSTRSCATTQLADWTMTAGGMSSRVLAEVPGGIRGMALNPDGSKLAIALDSESSVNTSPVGILLWNLQTQQQSRVALASSGDADRGTGPLAFSPDGVTLAAGVDYSCSVDSCRRIDLWDTDSGRLVERLPAAVANVWAASAVESLAFSRDGMTLAGFDGATVHVWALDSAKIVDEPNLITTRPYLARIESFALRADAHLLALGRCSEPSGPDSQLPLQGACSQSVIQLWDVTSHRLVGPPLITTYPSEVVSTLLTPDGGTVLTAGEGDEPLLVWDLSEQSWLARACHIANRNLTQAEWTRFVGAVPYQKTCPDLPAA